MTLSDGILYGDLTIHSPTMISTHTFNFNNENLNGTPLVMICSNLQGLCFWNYSLWNYSKICIMIMICHDTLHHTTLKHDSLKLGMGVLNGVWMRTASRCICGRRLVKGSWANLCESRDVEALVSSWIRIRRNNHCLSIIKVVCLRETTRIDTRH